MSNAHIELLQTKLESSQWKLLPEYNPDLDADYWIICRPDGDCQLKLKFTIGGKGKFGALAGNETIENAIGCSVESHPHIGLYFGKFTKQFQVDLDEFIGQLNLLDKK